MAGPDEHERQPCGELSEQREKRSVILQRAVCERGGRDGASEKTDGRGGSDGAGDELEHAEGENGVACATAREATEQCREQRCGLKNVLPRVAVTEGDAEEEERHVRGDERAEPRERLQLRAAPRDAPQATCGGCGTDGRRESVETRQQRETRERENPPRVVHDDAGAVALLEQRAGDAEGEACVQTHCGANTATLTPNSALVTPPCQSTGVASSAA